MRITLAKREPQVAEAQATLKPNGPLTKARKIWRKTRQLEASIQDRGRPGTTQ